MKNDILDSQQEELLVILGLITSLPKDEKAKVIECAMKFRDLLQEYDAQGRIALAWVGIEERAKD